MADQFELFDNAQPETKLPEGFRYQPELICNDEERDLVREIEKLPLEEFEFHGYKGKRRVISFGWRYDFNDRELLKADDFPQFLMPLREKAANFARLPASDLQHVLITEYSEGAGIGWHKDKATFDRVIGVSLLTPCRFRFRRKVGAKWQRAEVLAEPRSVYLLSGRARSEWEHSIPEMLQLRYSITFRNFLGK